MVRLDSQLYLGDCIDILPTLKNISLIVADPPFNLDKDFDIPMTEREYYEWCDVWIELCFKCLSDTGSMFLMTAQQHVGEMMRSMGRFGTFRNMIVWFNSTIPQKNRFCMSYQPILWFVKDEQSYVFNYGVQSRVSNAVIPGKESNKNSAIRDIWDDIPFISGGCMASSEAVLVPGTRKKKHSAQMPIMLAQRAIMYCSNKGDVVLDPFMGSGTTGVACERTGRNFIGIEKKPYHYADAKERIDLERAQHKMF